MENELLNMKRYALAHGLCGVYTDAWDKVESIKGLVDLASDANGMPFMAEGVAFGWCPSEQYIKRVFADYINGSYISKHKGYTGEIWYGERSEKTFMVRTTSVLVAFCDVSIIVPKGVVCRIHVAGKGEVSVKCEGVAYIDVYGSDAELFVSGSGKTRVSHITERKFR